MTSRRKKVVEEEEEEEEEEEMDTGSTRSSKRIQRLPAAAAASSQNDENNADGEDNVPYSDFHRLLLQFFMTNKVVDETYLCQHEAALLFQTEHNVTRDQVLKLIKETNAMLSKEDLCLQIRPRQMVEFPGQPRVWGLVNTRLDEVSKMSTPLEPWELVFFQCCLRLLADPESDGVVRLSDATAALRNAENAPAGKSQTDCKRCLAKLIQLKWINPTTDDKYFTIGERSLLELNEFLQTCGAEKCVVNREVVIKTVAYKEWLSTRQ